MQSSCLRLILTFYWQEQDWFWRSNLYLCILTLGHDIEHLLGLTYPTPKGCILSLQIFLFNVFAALIKALKLQCFCSCLGLGWYAVIKVQSWSLACFYFSQLKIKIGLKQDQNKPILDLGLLLVSLGK
jgi:hypothetical protein